LPEPARSRSNRPILAINAVATGYGKRQILNDVSLAVEPGEIVALIGHNGAGKSTLLKTVFGLLPVWRGQLILDGKLLQSPNPRELLRAGVAYAPQGNRVFTDLTVHENLVVGGVARPDGGRLEASIKRALDWFPGLGTRLRQRAGTLSGGEKQMLALANALISSPRLLLLDEPSLGLAPPVVSSVMGHIQQISRDSGVAVLIVEQKVHEVLKIAHHVFVLRNGQVSFGGRPQALDDAKLRETYF